MRLPAQILWLTLWSVCVAQDCNGPPPRKQTEILTGSWSDQAYPQGTKATYKCRPGYRMYGVITMECKGGNWVALNPYKTCQKKPCGHPGDTPFGSFELAEGDKFEYGAKVVYTCDEGYQMIGDIDFRECDADGWTNDVPLCDDISCPVPQIENGEPTSPKASYRENERLQYKCLPGYTYGGRAETVCTQRGWTPPPSCQEKTCEIPRIANSHFQADRSKYRVGDRITYSCKRGFYPPTQGNTAKCTAMGWEPSPRCSFKPCDFPEIKHGRLHGEDRYRLSFPVSVGTWFYYLCDENYVTATESSWDYITCKPDGWTPKLPCRRRCIFNYLENGHRPLSEQQYLQGQSVNVSCYPGYTLQNQQTSLTCTENGWLPPPRCTRVEQTL
uniref:Complement factor H n=1 Tax=Pipistrellus kuhlii TaxID=59472 RepID=A0A7J7RJT3_PIPKU|nr:complement factor H [Pipistrellus kuhlii]